MVVKRGRRGVLALAALSVFALGLGGCRGETPPDPSPAAVSQPVDEETQVVRFDRELGGYAPKKKEYSFYFTYKAVHPWWDAVALGIEDAARQYEEERGVAIDYE